MTSLAVLFDLDGTLTDPRPGITGCIRYALDRLGRPCPSDDALATYIGPPLRRTFATLLDTEDRACVEEALSLYRERYGTVGLFENEVYEGIPSMLDRIGAVTSRRFVATAKPMAFAARIVERFGLDRHFAGIYGPDLDGRLDDKADLIAHLLKAEGLVPATTVMIGDRANDVSAARANHLRSVGVLWGYGSAEELRDAGADVLCASPADLESCLSGFDR